MKNSFAGLISMTLMVAALPASAAVSFAITALDANGFGQNTTVNYVEGFRFRPNQDLFVQEVGFFDSFSNGLIRSYKVGIVAPDNTILGSAIVPAGTAGRLDGPVDPGGPLLGGSAFRYAALSSPLHLVTGNTYALVALITRGNTDELPSVPTSISYNNLITVSGSGLGSFFDCRLAASGGCPGPPAAQITDLRYPTQFSSGARYVNFTFTPVPLPAAFPLFVIGLGVMGTLIRRRKK